MTGERWHALEVEIDACCRTGDRDGAMRAIVAWREHAEHELLAARASEAAT